MMHALEIRTGAGSASPFPAASPLLYRFEADVEVVPIGIVPEGLRLTISFEGRVTQGLLEGARVWGTDPLLLRRDGVGVIDAPKTLANDRVAVYEHVRGYCCLPEGMAPPPLEAIVAPGFAWPDALFPVHGFSMFRAGAPELEYLNHAIAAIEGWANFAKGRLAIETRLVDHTGAAQRPLT